MPARLMSLLYGRTHASKSSLLGTFATGLWREQGLKTRLYSGDGGGWLPMQHLVDAGVLDAWDLSEHIHPFETVNDAVRGAWPVDKADPASPLRPLWLPQWKVLCPKCGNGGQPKLIATIEKAPVPGNVCPTCKGLTVSELERRANPDNSLDSYGAVFFEGLTAFSGMFLENMSDRSAKGEKMGEEVAVKFKDGDLPVGGYSRSSYGVAQRKPLNAVKASRHLPVPYVFWTALLEKGKDDKGDWTTAGSPTYGPKLAGSAATDDAPREFGPLFYVVNIKGERRLYVKTYFEPVSDIPHPAGTRLPAVVLDGVPDFYKFDPSNATLLWDVVADIEKRLERAKGLLKPKGQPEVKK